MSDEQEPEFGDPAVDPEEGVQLVDPDPNRELIPEHGTAEDDQVDRGSDFNPGHRDEDEAVESD